MIMSFTNICTFNVYNSYSNVAIDKDSYCTVIIYCTARKINSLIFEYFAKKFNKLIDKPKVY